MQLTEQELTEARRTGEAVVRLIATIQQASESRRSERMMRRGLVEEGTSVPGSPARFESLPEGRLLVNTREAARMLSVSERTLRAMTAPRGPIPVIRFGRAVRYAVEDMNLALSTLRSHGKQARAEGNCT